MKSLQVNNLKKGITYTCISDGEKEQEKKSFLDRYTIISRKTFVRKFDDDIIHL